MTNDIDLQVFNMLNGLGCVYSSYPDETLGGGQWHACKHLETYVKTLDLKNPVAQEIQKSVAKIVHAEYERIMTDKKYNLVLDAEQRKDYRAFGEKQAAQAKAKLTYMIEQGRVKGQSMDSTKDMRLQDKAREQDTRAKTKAPQYRANKTNVADKPQPQVGVQTINRETVLRIIAERWNPLHRAA